MQIVDALVTPGIEQSPVYLGHPETFRHAFQQNVQALTQESPGARHHPQADRHGDHGVDGRPSRETG